MLYLLFGTLVGIILDSISPFSITASLGAEEKWSRNCGQKSRAGKTAQAEGRVHRPGHKEL